MTATDRLARVLGDEQAAAAVVDTLAQQNKIVVVDDLVTLPRGYTDARLVVVVVKHMSGRPEPRRYIVKLCPPSPYGRSQEGRNYSAALHESPKPFTEAHLARISFGPVLCGSGSVIVGQEIAGGSLIGHRPLSTLDDTDIIQACRTVGHALVTEWTGNDYDHQRATLAELLRRELRDSIEPDGWLRIWAEERAMLDPAHVWIEIESDRAYPNPLGLLLPHSPAAMRELHYLTGRCHGDLHSDNVLVPQTGGTPDPRTFRLIDLDTFESHAPLSRDIATLTISLVARPAGELPLRQQEALIRYLGSDWPTTPGSPPAEFADLARRVPSLVEIVRTLVNPSGTFIAEKGWLDTWRVQVKVSLLAQALLHGTYHSIPAQGRWWCVQLAAQLAQELLPDRPPATATPLRLASEVCGDAPAPRHVKTEVRQTTARQARSFVQMVNSQPPETGVQPGIGRWGFINRNDQCLRLRAALQDDLSPVIVVSGPVGVGKTRLVNKVLDELGWDGGDYSERRICRHEAAAGIRIDMKTLIHDIENRPAPSNRFLYGEASRVRLEAALEAYEGAPVVIVIDSAEHLLDNSHRLRDSDLDEALDVLSSRAHSPVKVVFVSQDTPRSDRGITWPSTAHPVPISGLREDYFRSYLSKLDPGAQFGLSTLPKEAFSSVHRRLQGNPRLAELLHALMTSADRDIGADDVAPWLSPMSADEVPQLLTDKLINGLPRGQQRVVEALAAFGTPVDDNTVVELLDPGLSRQRIREALLTLARTHVIRITDDGRYQVPASDVDLLLAHLASGDAYGETAAGPTQRDLLHRAANVLYSQLKDNADVRHVEDLHMHFARLDILLRARMYSEAHEFLALEIGPPLQEWNRATLLREQREAVRGNLDGDEEAEMENHNALGDVYSSLGLFPQALESYREALRLAHTYADLEALRKIYVNMGWMYWEHNEVKRARKYYDDALKISEEEDEDRMAALEGLAGCDRRYGAYSEAIEQAGSALGIAEQLHSSRAVDLALKLARWHAELGDMKEATQLLTVAEAAATQHKNRSLWAAYLDGCADLQLYQGDPPGAMGKAEEAVELALAQRDAVVLLQARTTLCLVYLHREKIVDASWEIERVARYRQEGRSLFVLALRALVARRRGNSSRATEHFNKLLQEARQRTGCEERDFAAWDFQGLALCARALDYGEPLDPAIQAFRRARSKTQPARGLVRNLAFMVGQLALCDERPNRFLPVLDLLDPDGHRPPLA